MTNEFKNFSFEDNRGEEYAVDYRVSAQVTRNGKTYDVEFSKGSEAQGGFEHFFARNVEDHTTPKFSAKTKSEMVAEMRKWARV